MIPSMTLQTPDEEIIRNKMSNSQRSTSVSIPPAELNGALLSNIERDGHDDLREEVVDKIWRLCCLHHAHAFVSEEMVTLLKDIFSLASEGCDHDMQRQYFREQLQEHLHLLKGSERSSIKIKEEFENVPEINFESYLGKIRNGIQNRRRNSELNKRKLAKKQLKRELRTAQKLSFKTAKRVKDLEDSNARMDQEIKDLMGGLQQNWIESEETVDVGSEEGPEVDAPGSDGETLHA
jgi:hypothetical protein